MVKPIAPVFFVALSACSISQFDDLAGQTVVHAQDKPDTSAATDFGIAVAPASPSTSQTGGHLIALGTGESTLDVFSVDKTGKTSSLVVESKVAGIAMLPTQPLLLRPVTAARANETALVVPAGDGTTHVLLAQGLDGTAPTFPAPFVVMNAPTTDGATYITPPGMTSEQILVASAGNVFGVDLATGAANAACALADKNGAPISVAALAALPNGASDQVLVWAKDGKLYLYPGTIWSACTTTNSSIAGVDVGFLPGTGARIIPDPSSTVVVLAAQQAGASGGPNMSASHVAAFDTATSLVLPMAYDSTDLSAATVLPGGFVVLGFSNRAVGSTTGAGAFEVHQVDATMGVHTEVAVAINRAQPDENGAFGRALSTMSFNGQTILVVGASGHVFLYYELPQVYPDARPM